MAFFLLLVMLTSCAASPQDLSGKMFTFGERSDTARVQLMTSREEFSAVTVCLRFFTDHTRDHVLFSLATPSEDNGFMILRYSRKDSIDVFTSGSSASFTEHEYQLNMWHSLCSTWDAASGLTQLWLDGKPSVRRLTEAGSNIQGPTIIMLGQEQDSHGGGFDIYKCFTGMSSDVHMWDHVLPSCEIQKYMEKLNFSPGNVLNWRALEFQITGRVVLEDNEMICD